MKVQSWGFLIFFLSSDKKIYDYKGGLSHSKPPKTYVFMCKKETIEPTYCSDFF
jgi:hypothetical protein